jgi:hypothetical protein
VPGLETETVLRSDLKALKRSRLRARVYLAGFVVLAGIGAHFGLRVLEDNASKYRELDQRYRALSQMSASATRAPRPAAAGATAASAGESNASAKSLADDLKRQLIGDAALSIEARGDRVVVGMDDSALFARDATEVGQAGFRVLFRFGKALKSVRDRRVVVTIISNGGLHARPWVTAVGRGLSLGRFLINDLGVEQNRVVVSAPAPRPRSAGAKNDRIEISLEPMGDSGRT